MKACWNLLNAGVRDCWKELGFRGGMTGIHAGRFDDLMTPVRRVNDDWTRSENSVESMSAL